VGLSVPDLRPLVAAPDPTDGHIPGARRFAGDAATPGDGMRRARLPPRPMARPRRPIRRVLAVIALLLVVAATLIGWRYGLPRDAELHTVRLAAFHRELRGPGTLDALRKASVGPNIQGTIATLPVDIGDVVHAGDVVATLAASDLSAEREAALASHEEAHASVALAQADRRKAEAARRNARSVLDRQQELMRSGTASRSTLESAETTMEQSLAEVARAEAAVLQAQAAEASAEASARVAAAQLEKATIRAPIDGVVVRRMNMGDLAQSGSVIVEIVAPESIVLSARFDESVMAAVTLGQPTRLLFSSTGEEVTLGEIRRIGREVDTETREFTVDIAPRTLPRNWAMGQRGSAILTLDERAEVLSVPLAAIASNAHTRGVFVLEDERARWRPVTLGAIGQGRAEVRAGLRPGDIVLAQPEAAYPGMKVSAQAHAPRSAPKIGSGAEP